MSHAPNSPAGTEVHSDDEKALELRVAGKTFREIAKITGCSLSVAHDRVDRALAHSKEAVAAKGAEYRELEAHRLNTLLSKLWPVAVGETEVLPKTDDEGNARKTVEEATLDGQHKAVDRVLRIMERRAKMLGLDAPAKTEVTGKDGGAIDIRAAAAEIAAINATFAAGAGSRAGPDEASDDEPGDAGGDAGGTEGSEE